VKHSRGRSLPRKQREQNTKSTRIAPQDSTLACRTFVSGGNVFRLLLIAATVLLLLNSCSRFRASHSDMELVFIEPDAAEGVSELEPFFLAPTETTQLQWRRIMGRNPSARKGDLLPVEQVTWEEAMEYCQRLTALDRSTGKLPKGYRYTLPTQAQWHYVFARGGGPPPAEELSLYAWFEDNAQGTTHPVATLMPNSLGIYDLLGNVAEWCLDQKFTPDGTELRGLQGHSWMSNKSFFEGPTESVYLWRAPQKLSHEL